MTAADFEVRRADDMDPAELVDVLSAGYGRRFTTDWFEWKHRTSPWGPSASYVATDADGILGVVFGMPWRLRIRGQTIEASRLVDGATTPRAARRGVFRSVVAAHLADWRPDDRPEVVIATATPEAQAAHIKNGAVALDAVDSAYRSVRWSRASIESGENVLESFLLPADDGRVITAWDTLALQWRLDRRSGIDYEISRLAHSSSAHGVVHRTVSHRGLRTIVLAAHWGPEPEWRRLVGALAWLSKAVAILTPSGPGAAEPMPRIPLRRGRSLLCIWDRRSGELVPSLGDRSAWALNGFDLEGVI